MCQEIEFKPYSRIRDPQNIKHLYKLFEFFLPKMGLNLIRKGFICVVTIICFQTIIVTGDNLCNLCKCLNDGTYYMDIKCMNNFDMIYGYLQWPQTRRKIETYFVNLTKFPKYCIRIQQKFHSNYNVLCSTPSTVSPTLIEFSNCV